MAWKGLSGFGSASIRRWAWRAGFAACAAAAPAAAQDYSAWAHSKPLYFDTSPTGAGVPGDVAGFPVLLRLTAADFPFAEARGKGQDLRFSAPDGAPMPYQIEAYDSAAGQAAIWILADRIKGNSQGELLRMHWGNPAAPASGDSGKVFTSANGFAAVWHLGGRYQNPRANSVPGGMEAVTGNYDADEQAKGIIGFADSLDGASPGDHLQTWQAFDTLSKAFTFSIWAYPTAVASWERLLDFGNGARHDNLVLSRAGLSDTLRFENWNDTNISSISAPGAIVQGEWQHFAVTVSGKTARIYRNGVEAAAGELAHPIAAVPRGSQYLGRGNWPGNAYFRGILDEPEISAAARSADWIKLAYANQKPAQTLLSYEVPCAARFSAPSDTSVPEGTALTLAGVADCADQFAWSIVEGPSIRLLDAEVKALDIVVPRLAGDSALVLRFTARYGDSTVGGNVRISIRNTIPEPAFSLPGTIAWSGRDSLLVRPQWSNLAAMEDSGMPALRLSWTLGGVAVDTLWRPEGLVLLPSPDQGIVQVSLCIDNGGPATCRTARVDLSATTAAGRPAPGPSPAARSRSGYAADGRFHAAAGRFGPLYATPGLPGRSRTAGMQDRAAP